MAGTGAVRRRAESRSRVSCSAIAAASSWAFSASSSARASSPAPSRSTSSWPVSVSRTAALRRSVTLRMLWRYGDDLAARLWTLASGASAVVGGADRGRGGGRVPAVRAGDPAGIDVGFWGMTIPIVLCRRRRSTRRVIGGRRRGAVNRGFRRVSRPGGGADGGAWAERENAYWARVELEAGRPSPGRCRESTD